MDAESDYAWRHRPQYIAASRLALTRQITPVLALALGFGLNGETLTGPFPSGCWLILLGLVL
ncbi:MAG: hypothetical protein WBM40_14140 [Thiohalocapsa sp.]